MHKPPAIAVVDTGVDTSRADFGGRVVSQVTLTSLPGNSAGDGSGHGTFVAGLAAGSAQVYAGAAPTAPIVSIDVADDKGMSMTSDVIAAVDWILANKAAKNIRVANSSLHSSVPSSFAYDPLAKAVERLWLSGVVVVAAAGNYASNGAASGIRYAPANDPFVITVGAADIGSTMATADDVAAPWSAHGYTLDGFAKPELGAPGRYLVGARLGRRGALTRTAGKHRLARLHAALGHLLRGPTRRRNRRTAPRAPSGVDAGSGQGRADGLRSKADAGACPLGVGELDALAAAAPDPPNPNASPSASSRPAALTPRAGRRIFATRRAGRPRHGRRLVGPPPGAPRPGRCVLGLGLLVERVLDLGVLASASWGSASWSSASWTSSLSELGPVPHP